MHQGARERRVRLHLDVGRCFVQGPHRAGERFAGTVPVLLVGIVRANGKRDLRRFGAVGISVILFVLSDVSDGLVFLA